MSNDCQVYFEKLLRSAFAGFRTQHPLSGPTSPSLLQKPAQTLAQHSAASQLMHSQQANPGCFIPFFALLFAFGPLIRGVDRHHLPLRNLMTEPKAPVGFLLWTAEGTDVEF